MKSFCLLLLVAAAQGLEKERVIPAPSIISVTTLDPADVLLEWTAVAGHPQEPIKFYILKVWEVPAGELLFRYSFKIIDGVKQLVLEKIPAEPTTKIPSSTPQEYFTEKTSFRVTKIKLGVLYQFRVQANSEWRESALSEPFHIKIHAS